MRVEIYLLDYIRQHDISRDQMIQDTGIDLEMLVSKGKELVSDEFLGLCMYLGITPDEVSDQIL